jgi:hypothetical protein
MEHAPDAIAESGASIGRLSEIDREKDPCKIWPSAVGLFCPGCSQKRELASSINSATEMGGVESSTGVAGLGILVLMSKTVSTHLAEPGEVLWLSKFPG